MDEFVGVMLNRRNASRLEKINRRRVKVAVFASTVPHDLPLSLCLAFRAASVTETGSDASKRNR